MQKRSLVATVGAMALTLALVSVAAAQVWGSPLAQYQDPGSATGNIAGNSDITLKSPGTGASIAGDRILVSVQVSGLKLDGVQINKPNQEGVGHWHVYVDDKYAGLSVSDLVSVPNDALTRISKGQHKIAVELHGNDHSAVAGSSRKEVTINVENDMSYDPGTGSPAISFVSPTDNAGTNIRVEVKVKVSGFKMDGVQINKPNQPGVGHWHLYVDDKYAGLSVSDYLSIPNDAYPNLLPGKHKLAVELHGNDHSPVTGVTSQTIMVDIAPAGPTAVPATATGAMMASPSPMITGTATSSMMITGTATMGGGMLVTGTATSTVATPAVAIDSSMVPSTPTAAMGGGMMATPTTAFTVVAVPTNSLPTPTAVTAGRAPGLPRTGAADSGWLLWVSIIALLAFAGSLLLRNRSRGV